MEQMNENEKAIYLAGQKKWKECAKLCYERRVDTYRFISAMAVT